MQVFNTYFKIVKKNIGTLSIYFIIFILISVLLVNQQFSTMNVSKFEDYKANIAIFNYDKGSEFSNNFVKFLSKQENVIELNDDKQVIQDTLFYKKVVYIVKIPEGFGQNFINGNKEAQIEKTTVAGTTDSIFIDFLIEKYLNAARLYLSNIPNISSDKLANYLEKDMSVEANVQMHTFGKTIDTGKSKYYFSYYAYVALATIITGVSEILIVFNSTEIKKRNLASPMKLSNYNFQTILASLVFSIVFCILVCALGVIMYSNEVLNKNLILLVLNAIIISFVTLCISYLIGNILKSKQAISAIANITSLGLSFISGIFVPQELISSSVLKIASFTPTYWYVKAVNEIQSLTSWSIDKLLPIIYSMLIQIGFAFAILSIALVIIRQKRSVNQL